MYKLKAVEMMKGQLLHLYVTGFLIRASLYFT